MHRYFIKTPWLVRKLFGAYVWKLPAKEKVLYLTFDDGPHPAITPWVLEQLRQYDAKASFFCIGDNVRKFPDVYAEVLAEGHRVGNHTYNHLNGWQTDAKEYLDNVRQAAGLIASNLFRPPYGRIRRGQARGIAQALGTSTAAVVMWDVLSADFDRSITAEQCLQNVVKHYEPGSVIVFHDSEKAFPHLSFALPRLLARWEAEGYRCCALPA